MTGPLTIDGQSSNDKVNVGVGDTRKINGPVTVRSQFGRVALNVDDSADTVARNVTFATSGGNGTITGLSPAVISYVQDDLSSLTVSGPNTGLGAAGNTFTVADTFSSTAIGAAMTLNSGNGVDTVNVQRTTAPLTINGQNGRDIVNVGHSGSMQSIGGTLTVKNSFSFSTLNLNDQSNGANHNVTMSVTNTGFGDTGTITGMTPASAAVKYTAADIGTLNVNTGAGADTFTVNGTHQNGSPASTTINSGGGIDTVNVRATLGPLALKLGAGNDKANVGSTLNTLDAIQGTVTVDGQGDIDSLNVNDQGSVTPHVYTTSSTTFTRTGAANVTFSNVESPKLNKGAETTGAGTAPQVSNLVFPTTITLGHLATLTGKLVDPDSGSTLKLIVNWGDGSKLDKTTPNQSQFTRTHKYAKAGKYAVRITWIDNTGRSNRKDLILTVKK
jgi:acrosin